MPSLRLPQLNLSLRRGRPPGHGRRIPRSAPRRFALGPAPRVAPPRRLPWRRIALTLSCAAVVAGLAYGAAWLLLGDSLRVRDIHVRGTEIVEPLAAAAAAGIGGQSMLWLDAGGAADRVAALPGVRAVSIERRWPRGVVLQIEEHQAWGYWQVGDLRVEIDIEGRVLEAARPPRPGAPTIIELAPRAQSASDQPQPDPDTVSLVARLTADGTLDRLDVEPAAFLFRSGNGLTVRVEDGPDAVFGDSSHYGFKVATWEALLDDMDPQVLVSASEIDLRFGRNVVLR